MMAHSPIRAHLVLLLVPAALLGGALAAQHAYGLYPCEMCMWQRWPHVVALILASLALFVKGGARASCLLLAALALGTSGAIGAFHAGVEYGFWTGPTTCTAPPSASDDFMTAIIAAPVVRCDTAPWSLFGISLAGYNALISLLSAGVALWLMKRR
ncbi:disulfide bond formation protein B [Pacificimonas sp. WHA3]|uniref:Disulfide bond formation protein B n=1 Tax=Pacificimonas pallii TaxID=2827236 RepID=A0ABS6SDI3_9SPHN|nr:disulfide bond formation protein B [Pacificimonas pallii]MBV7255986.1 disulfide bond formation protein B [Pacificimonas pallii]